MTWNNTIEPTVRFDLRLNKSANLFRDVFGDLSPAEWLKVLITSIETRKIQGVEFPGFPPAELQSRIHGHAGAQSLNEAASFYNFVRAQGLTGPEASWYGEGRMLDFGSGWGRILRPFLRDFPLRNIIGSEPNSTFCTIARAQNPFVSFVNGHYLPPTIFGDGQFNLIVGWSVFSHLSEDVATKWLSEFARLLSPGGAAVLSTWGVRFLERLRHEEVMLNAGKEVHWHSKRCLQACGDLHERIRAYNEGEFVWFHIGHNTKFYGQAFLGEAALARIIKTNSLPLSLELFDANSLVQDVFILRRH